MNRYIVVAILIIIGWVYWQGMARDLVGFADSDELVVSAYHLGIPHAPGYPLATYLGHFAIHQLEFISSIPQRTHFLSLLFHLFGLVLYYLISLELLNLVKSKLDSFTKQVIALGSTVILGLNFLYWQYALVWEVMSLANFLTLFNLWYAFWLTSKNRTSTYWIVWGLSLGLMFSHHHLSWLLLPGLLFITWNRSSANNNKPLPRFVLTGSTTVLTGVIMYSSLWWLKSLDSAITWEFEPSIVGWLGFIFRQLYSGYLSGGEHISGSYLSVWPSIDNLQFLIRYIFEYLPAHFGIVGWFLMLVGFASAKKLLSKKIFWSLTTIIITAPLVAFYLYTPSITDLSYDSILARAMTERMYLLGYPVLALLLPIGIARLFAWTKSLHPQYAVHGIIALLITTSIWLYQTNVHAVSLANYELSTQKFTHILNQVEDDAIIVCYSDWSCFGLLAHRYLYNQNQSVIIPIAPQLRHQYLDNFRDIPYAYPDNPQRLIQAVITPSYLGKPVYLTEITPLFSQLSGLNHDIIPITPTWFGIRASCSTPQSAFDLPSDMIFPDLNQIDPRASYKLHHLQILERYNQLTSSHDPKSITDTCQDPESLYTTAKACLSSGDNACALQYGLWNVLSQPNDIDSRLLLAEIYRANGLLPLANRETRIAQEISRQD